MALIQMLIFSTLQHPQLLLSFIDYVNLNKDYIGLTKIENRQSIEDSVWDVFVDLEESETLKLAAGNL